MTTQIEEGGALVKRKTNGSTGGDLFVAALGLQHIDGRRNDHDLVKAQFDTTISGITGIESVVNLAVEAFSGSPKWW